MLAEAQTILRQRVCGKEISEQVEKDFKTEFDNLYSVLKRTVEYGEGNSLLVVGKKGCGKSAIVKAVLNKLKKLKNYEKNVYEVHLSGLLQTDDR